MGPERPVAGLPLRRRLRPRASFPAAAHLGSAAVLWLIAALCFPPPSSLAAQGPPVELTFLDVGQGDAIVVREPGGGVVMVDAGPEPPLRPLSRMGVDSIALLVATHPARRHIGGVDGILTTRPVEAYLDDGRSYDSALRRGARATVDRVAGVARLGAREQLLQIGELEVEVLPLAPSGPDGAIPSVGLVLRHGAFTALLPGDAKEAQLDAWVTAGDVPEVTLLKASSHGSEDGFTFPFVEAAAPEIVVISLGGESLSGHPRAEALTAYGSVARDVLRTDLRGHIRVRGFPDGRYEILAGPRVDALELVDPPEGADRDHRRPAEVSATGVPDADDSAAGAEREGGGPSEPLALEVVVDADGWRPGDLNRDFVQIRNRGERRLDLSGWRLCDLTTRCFRFPAGSSVPPERMVVVYTGYGMPDGASFFMNNDRRIWNEDGDEATLYDDDGRLVVRHVY